ncbi:MAG: alpha/beta hydrolase [Flavobacteriales bacterium]|nr:alpha/beta hydrolase [Flavobacteriales bacterium]MBK6943422.1 alpha/beta hydrolase [Flavobacteriales bacterium]MBK7240691.1 alpha/beta hydrolase [Flavobacteriales bacterium]MBK9536043.1 alpha/beta hydrolase [Flavobacteriales bacterium]HQV52077.1 alpha/beta hydrolase-fold protein [Flavobacteriales bacterium]
MKKDTMTKAFLICSLALATLNSAATAQSIDSIPDHNTFTISSTYVNEPRVINVWVPPSYITGSDSLPVLYMPDGGVNEDFPHIANTLAELISSKRIPPIILVGIDNTERRRDLTGPTNNAEDKEIAPVVGGSADFRDFIEKELVAEIDGIYRTTDKRGIIGESLAGLFVVETLLLRPELFDFYIAMDPSLWWNDMDMVKTAPEYLAKFPAKPIRFWFAGSSVQEETPFISNLSGALELTAPKTLVWQYSDEPNETHATIFRATKEKALVWVLGGEK